MEVTSNFSEKAKRDYELVTAARDGDQKAFAELLGNYKESLYYMLLKMVKNKDDAEDLTIEAFGKAFKSLESYTPNFAFSTWLFKIASNNCIDFLRGRKTSKKHISIDTSSMDGEHNEPMSIASNTPDPEEYMITKQKEKYLRIIVKKLHPEYRKIITMRYFDELSYAEIAEKLALPLGTVKARLFRSRELLISTMKENNLGLDKF